MQIVECPVNEDNQSVASLKVQEWTGWQYESNWVKIKSRNVQWSTSSGRLHSFQLTKPCTAVSLPEQRRQHDSVPRFRAVCSLWPHIVSNIVFMATSWKFTQNTHIDIAAIVAKFLLLPDEERERKTWFTIIKWFPSIHIFPTVCVWLSCFFSPLSSNLFEFLLKHFGKTTSMKFL